MEAIAKLQIVLDQLDDIVLDWVHVDFIAVENIRETFVYNKDTGETGMRKVASRVEVDISGHEQNDELKRKLAYNNILYVSLLGENDKEIYSCYVPFQNWSNTDRGKYNGLQQVFVLNGVIKIVVGTK